MKRSFPAPLLLLLASCLLGACQEALHWPEDTGMETTRSIESDVQSTLSALPPSSAAQMKKSAAALIASLSAEEVEKAMAALTDEEARTAWSNLPAAIFEREGLRVGDLTENQRRLLHDLLRASTSSQGYMKVTGIMWLEDVLHEQSLERLAQRGNDDFFARLVESWRSDNYWFSFFGDPTKDANWAWMISGHHLAANFTVVDDQVAFTPLFLGAEPYEVQQGPYAGWRVLSHEVERGFELMQSLSDAQRQEAVLAAEIPRDVLEGPGRKASLEGFEGIAADRLTDDQKELTWHLIREYVENADHDAADLQLAKIERDGLNQLYFSWIGPTDDISKRYYYRVHGPSILIEYIRERGIGEDQGAANHIHSIVRDPSNDYGEDWLELHYQEHHREARR